MHHSSITIPSNTPSPLVYLFSVTPPTYPLRSHHFIRVTHQHPQPHSTQRAYSQLRSPHYNRVTHQHPQPHQHKHQHYSHRCFQHFNLLRNQVKNLHSNPQQRHHQPHHPLPPHHYHPHFPHHNHPGTHQLTNASFLFLLLDSHAPRNVFVCLFDCLFV